MLVISEGLRKYLQSCFFFFEAPTDCLTLEEKNKPRKGYGIQDTGDPPGGSGSANTLFSQKSWV
jgi:hypothetical protein